MTDYAGKTVWIIGASSGIGYAMAHELHKRGARLILSARNEILLKKLNDVLSNQHRVLSFDVADKKAFGTIFENLEKVDSTIYLAAAYTPGRITEATPEDIEKTISINLEGAFTLLHHLIPFYKRQRAGQIALCGSVAGYKGLPCGQPYSATKAAIINLAESLRTEMAKENIDVRLISPGFVKTALTDKNDFPMPMMIEPEEAARAIADGLLEKDFEIHFPKKFTLLMKFLNLLPYALFFPLARSINR